MHSVFELSVQSFLTPADLVGKGHNCIESEWLFGEASQKVRMSLVWQWMPFPD